MSQKGKLKPSGNNFQAKYEEGYRDGFLKAIHLIQSQSIQLLADANDIIDTSLMERRERL